MAHSLSSRPKGQISIASVFSAKALAFGRAVALVCSCSGLAGLASAPTWAQTANSAAENDKAAPDPVVLALNRAREFRAKGELSEALRLVDKALESTPRDLQLRFMKGLIFSDQAQTDASKTDLAIAVFEGLTQDFPEVGEPHNNLAVLLAGKGELEKARYALERAILAQPNYALAYENLGDIYLRLAERSYGEASIKSPSSKSAKAKLDQARGWIKAIEK